MGNRRRHKAVHRPGIWEQYPLNADGTAHHEQPPEAAEIRKKQKYPCNRWFRQRQDPVLCETVAHDRLTSMCAPVRFTGSNFQKETAQEKLERLKQLMKQRKESLWEKPNRQAPPKQTAARTVWRKSAWATPSLPFPASSSRVQPTPQPTRWWKCWKRKLLHKKRRFNGKTKVVIFLKHSHFW